MDTIAVASSAEKLDFCKELGAIGGVNYRENPQWGKQVLEFTNGRGVDLIFDPVLGGPNFNENLDVLAMDSRWVLYGTMGGISIEKAPLVKLLGKRA